MKRQVLFMVMVMTMALLGLTACGGGGGGDSEVGDTSIASYVGAWDVTLATDNICGTGIESIFVSASITEGFNGELLLWLVDSRNPTIPIVVSGADANWENQEITLNVGGIDITFITNADLSISGDSISGTLSYASDSELCAGSFALSATRVNADALPDAPTAVTVDGQTATSLSLSWDDASNEWGYTLSRMGPGETDYTKIATLGMDVHSFTDSGLVADAIYHYSVAAYNNVGVSTAVTTDGTTTAIPVPPVAPSGLSATDVRATAVDIIWTDNSDNEESFSVQYCKTPADGTFCFLTVETVAAGSTTYTITGMDAATSYDIRVCANNAAGTECSSAITVFTDAMPYLPAAPSTPVVGDVTDTTIPLVWKDNSTNEDNMVVKYCVTPPKFVLCSYVSVTLAPDTTSYTIQKLKPETSYDFMVCAVNEAGEACSSKVTQTTLAAPVLPPDAPTDLLAGKAVLSKTGDYSVTLTWTDNASNEDNFVLELSLRSDFAKATQISLAPNTTTYTITALPGSYLGYARVKAVNAGGSSAYSNVVTVSTPFVIPL